MEGNKTASALIDEYISQFPPAIQQKLKKLRKAIKEAAPEAEEKIAYRMPAYALNGPLVYFAAFKDHISLFPTGSPMEGFKEDLSAYRTAKGTLQFALDKPMPYDLIKKIVKFRVAENMKKAGRKSNKN
jgi:uncharacterized protein YdhG (YjbR/CyaY superfamily)